MKLKKISVLTTRTTTNMERRFPVFNSSFDILGNTLALLDKLLQIISMEPHIYDLDIWQNN